MKIMNLQEFHEWSVIYMNSKTNSTTTKEDLEKLHHEIERDLYLLGATALEDKLQENVPSVIEDFREAGINVWMLTGDKLETAENIGFSCKIFTPDDWIFRLYN
jgi:P-type E1-E2 ATPase